MHRRTGSLVVLATLLGAGTWFLRSSEEPAPTAAVSASVERVHPPVRRKLTRRSTALKAAPVVARAPVAEPVDDDAPFEVGCLVGRGLEGREHVLTVDDPSQPGGAALQQGSYDGATLTLTASPAARGAQIVFPGTSEPSVLLDWTRDGAGPPRCTVTGALPAPADAPLFGTVGGAANLPDGTVFLEGCAASDQPVGADGSFFAVTAEGPCKMRAWRQAGSLRIPGPWVAVDAIAGVEVEVALSVPTFAPAGMGIGFTSPGGGITVAAVHSGTPAVHAGLGVGDRITAIDGVPTEGMDADGFLQHGIGPEGSEVHLQGTTADGEAFDVTLTRQAIGSI